VWVACSIQCDVPGTQIKHQIAHAQVSFSLAIIQVIGCLGLPSLPRARMRSRGKAMPLCLCVCVCVSVEKNIENASSRVAKVFTDVIVSEKQSA